MPTKYQRLLTLLNCFEYKINELSTFRISNSHYSKIVENSQICILENHLEIELIDLSQMFDISKKSAIILCSMFFNSFSQEGLVSKIVSEQDLTLSVCLALFIISDLQNAILELEVKNIITVNVLNDSTERSFSLTRDFIKTITKL